MISELRRLHPEEPKFEAGLWDTAKLLIQREELWMFTLKNQNLGWRCHSVGRVLA